MKQIEIRRKWPKLYKHISQRASEFYDKMMETQNDSDIELTMSAFEYDGNVIRLLWDCKGTEGIYKMFIRSDCKDIPTDGDELHVNFKLMPYFEEFDDEEEQLIGESNAKH